jgi:hypothetical protein
MAQKLAKSGHPGRQQKGLIWRRAVEILCHDSFN